MGNPIPARTDPYSEQELREMYDRGDTLATIFVRAHKLNKWGRGKVREVIFGREY